MPSITIKRRFELPLREVFEALSLHETYNLVLWPLRSERIVDSEDPARPDSIGSIRKMGIPPIMPIREEILRVVDGELIEYAMHPNALFPYHLGRLVFSDLKDEGGGCELVYTISLESRLPLADRLVLAQLKLSATLGLAALERRLGRSPAPRS